MLELQPAFAGSVGHCFHAAVIAVPRAIEHDAGKTSILCFPRDQLPDRGRSFALLASQLVIRHRRQRPIAGVVHELRVDVLERPEHDETRALRRAADALAHAQVTAVSELLPTLWPSNLAHFCPPVL